MLFVALPVMNEYLFINSAGLVPVIFRQEGTAQKCSAFLRSPMAEGGV
jgi:hypothetical protein